MRKRPVVETWKWMKELDMIKEKQRNGEMKKMEKNNEKKEKGKKEEKEEKKEEERENENMTFLTQLKKWEYKNQLFYSKRKTYREHIYSGKLKYDTINWFNDLNCEKREEVVIAVLNCLSMELKREELKTHEEEKNTKEKKEKEEGNKSTVQGEEKMEEIDNQLITKMLKVLMKIVLMDFKTSNWNKNEKHSFKKNLEKRNVLSFLFFYYMKCPLVIHKQLIFISLVNLTYSFPLPPKFTILLVGLKEMELVDEKNTDAFIECIRLICFNDNNHYYLALFNFIPVYLRFSKKYIFGILEVLKEIIPKLDKKNINKIISDGLLQMFMFHFVDCVKEIKKNSSSIKEWIKYGYGSCPAVDKMKICEKICLIVLNITKKNVYGCTQVINCGMVLAFLDLVELLNEYLYLKEVHDAVFNCLTVLTIIDEDEFPPRHDDVVESVAVKNGTVRVVIQVLSKMMNWLIDYNSINLVKQLCMILCNVSMNGSARAKEGERNYYEKLFKETNAEELLFSLYSTVTSHQKEKAEKNRYFLECISMSIFEHGEGKGV
jgi:hypothetical protein